MKKFLLFIISLLVIIPLTVSAKEYQLNDDITISIDDSIWYVFTRDNLKDNPELDELGITYDYMNNLFNNNYMYMDAIVFYTDSDEYMELILRIKENSAVKNFTNYEKDDLMDFAKEIAKKTNSTNYDIYENNYKFLYSNYFDSTLNYYIDEYYSIVNGIGYTITVQKEQEFDFNERQAIRNIVDTIKFNIDESLKEDDDLELDFDSIFESGIEGAIIGAIIGGILSLIRIIVAVIIIVKDSKKKKI